jgi:acyl-CoA oxidase
MVRFGAKQFAGVVIERTAARGLVQRLIDSAPGRDSEKGPLDRGWQLELFEDRERHLLETVALRLRKAGKPGADLFAVFNDAQDHVVEAARAHVDRVVLESFVAAIEACDDPSASQLLERVCDLYALSSIEQDRGWFLEHGRITPARSKQVTASVNDLCATLRPQAQVLVDAFGIPHAWLGTELLEEPV